MTCARTPVLAALLALTGCGAVGPLSIDDPRLSLESRRTLAGAEDAVSVTIAAVARAEIEVLKAEERRHRYSTAVTWPPAGASAASARAALADANVEQATLKLAAARALLALERAKRDQVVARLSIRHEIAAYDLEALKSRVDEARDRLAAAARAAHDYSEQLLALEAAWWTAYQAYLKGGGDKRALWTVK